MKIAHAATIALLAIFLSALSGCGGPDAAGDAPRSGSFVRDSAKVVSVDPILGQAILDYRGRQIRAYWQTELVQAREGMVSRPDPVRSPIGEYREPVAAVQAFDANPGDTIEFQGMWTGNDVFLRGIRKVSGP